MRLPNLLLVVCIAVMVLAATPSGAGEDAKPIYVSQLEERRPIGLLGKPLGDRLTVAGTRVEGGMIANPLAIEKVDGLSIPKPITLETSGAELKPAVAYQLEGYETGGFQGEPGWHAPDAQQPFTYHPSFIITRVIQPAAK